MNDLTQLRSTLNRHADDVETGTPAGARLDAVHGRVAAVRRRRRTGLAVGAVAAAAVVAGTSLLGPGLGDGSGDAEVAGQSLAGHAAPATMTSLGAEYAFQRGVTGDGSAELRVTAPEDEPLLVSWASESGDLSLAEYYVPGEATAPAPRGADDFDDFVYVAPGKTKEIVATGDGEVALATYTLQTPAQAVGDGPLAFRTRVADSPILGAGMATPGAKRLNVGFEVPEGAVRVAPVCIAPADLVLHVELPGGGVDLSCSPTAAVDPGGHGGWSTDGPLREEGGQLLPEGMQVQAQVWVADPDDPFTPISDESITYGVGIYAEGESVGEIGGTTVSRFAESEGHVYETAGVQQSEPGADSYEVTVQGPGLVTFGGDKGGSYQVSIDGTVGTGVQGGGIVTESIPPGEHTVVVSPMGDTQGRVGVAIYQRAD